MALNAARTAISVLPKPTSPTTSRSMGASRSMSCFTSAMAWSWSRVSWYSKASSSSRCQGVSGAKGWPGAVIRRRYSSTSSWAISCTALRTRALAAAQSEPPMRDTVGVSPPV